MTETRNNYTPSSQGKFDPPDTSQYDENGVDQFGFTKAQKENAMARLAQRFAAEPDTMAALFAQYCKIEGIDEAKLLERLGASPERLTRLRLCLLPREESFGDDVRTIAKIGNVDPSTVATIINHVRMISKLPLRSIKNSETVPRATQGTKPTFGFGQIHAMAARDRLADAATLREGEGSYANAAPAPADSPADASTDAPADSSTDTPADTPSVGSSNES